MRYNERELLSLSRQPAEKAAEVLMRAPKKGSVVKKRLVKLVVNFLFYFRTDDAEPIGALLLEHCKISRENGNVFSISFSNVEKHLKNRMWRYLGRRANVQRCELSQATACFLKCVRNRGFLEEPERKYYFECDTDEQCQEWIEVLRRASYEFMRSSLIFYRNEIQKMTGKDPLEQYGISEEARFQLGARKL